MKRNSSKPSIKGTFWKIKDGLYFVEKADLMAAIVHSRRSEAEIRSRMGVGYKHLTEALEGIGIDGWQAAHVEWGIL